MSGQHWQQHDLKPGPARDLVDRSGISAGERVWEVGAGLGNLTAPLLQAGAQVQAVELDARRCAGLRDRFAEAIADGGLQVLQGDALRLSPQRGPWRVVANPPFQHTAALLRAWLLKPGSAGSPSAIDLLIQTQAAGKLAGRPGAQTRSSALLGLWGSGGIRSRLSRDVTDPPSRVDLCHWSLTRVPSAPDLQELQLVDRLLEIAFAGPRTLREALGKRATPAILKRQGAQFGYRADDHPRALSPEAWLGLARFLSSIGKLS